MNLKKLAITMNNLNKIVKIKWNDTKMFSPENRDIRLTPMETTGILEAEHEHYLLVKNPTTINLHNSTKHPEQKPTFYLIPKGMIENIQASSL